MRTALVAIISVFALPHVWGGDLDQPHDFRDRSPSEENTQIPSARTADDFLSPDEKYGLQNVTFSMIVNHPGPPTQFAVEFFFDRSGEDVGPGEFIGRYSSIVNVDDRGAWNGNDDLHLLDVTIHVGGLHLFTGAYWLSPYAIGDGSGRAWWGTSGDGVVSGSEGYFMSDHFGVPEWTPISDSGILDFPTDFAFTLDPVPGPAVLAMLGLAALARNRRRHW